MSDRKPRKALAVVLPTRQKISGVEMKTMEETCAAVSQLFERCVEPWAPVQQ